MIDPVSATASIRAVAFAGTPVQPPPPGAEAPLPVREADSASFSPEALAMLEAQQASESG